MTAFDLMALRLLGAVQLNFLYNSKAPFSVMKRGLDLMVKTINEQFEKCAFFISFVELIVNV